MPMISKLRPYEHHAKYCQETDQMGIIHHFKLHQMDGRERGSHGSDRTQLQTDGGDGDHKSCVSRICEYHSMVHFDDTVVIRTKITRYNGIKMDVEYQMTDKGRRTADNRKEFHCF